MATGQPGSFAAPAASGPALAAGEGFRALACLLTALAAWHQRDLVASARAARAAATAG